jgi:ATP-dependent DNA helicase RecQ
LVPRLLKPALEKKKESKLSTASWEGVDRGLFEALRVLRRRKADERGIAAFIVFSDVTLRALAAKRPTSMTGFLSISGIGEKKAAEYGDDFLPAIAEYCRENSVPMDVELAEPLAQPRPRSSDSSPSGAKRRAFELFQQGKSIDEVCELVGRARSTVTEYLTEFITTHGISDPAPWIDDDLFARIRAATKQHGAERLKPLFEAFGGAVSYDQLRIALACLRNTPPDDLPAE